MKGFVVWFTGLSGAGKSTLATLLASELSARGVHVEVLDGDEVRTYLSKGLGFSREDRDTNVRRIGFVAKLLARAGACAITAAISPYRSIRDEQRAAIGRFVEVYCKCSIEDLTARDPKGLYKKALAGEIQNFTGVTDPYEEPVAPELELDTATLGVDECLAKIVAKLEELGLLSQANQDRRPAPWGGPIAPARSADTTPTARLDIDAATADLLGHVAFGSFSPLRGPMNEKDLTKLEKEGRLESGVSWPLAVAVPAPDAQPTRPGQIVALRAPGGHEHLLEVTEDFTRDGCRLLAGEILVAPPREVTRLRVRMETEPLARAAGFLARRPLGETETYLLSIAAEARGAVVIFVASTDPAVLGSARAFADASAAEVKVAVETIPPVPTLGPEHDPIMQIALLRNLGVSCAVLDAPHGEAAPHPRDVLARLRPSEIGIDVVASGPVTQLAGERLATRRMSSMSMLAPAAPGSEDRPRTIRSAERRRLRSKPRG